MPLNWQRLVRMLAAVLHALEALPPEYDHGPLATTALELLQLCADHSPPQPD